MIKSLLMGKSIFFSFSMMVLFMSCNNDEQISTNNLELYESYYDNGTLKTKGFIDSKGLRDSIWEFKNFDATIKAKGEFDKDFKVGDWRYYNGTYNKTNIISWEIENYDLFSINIPKDWEVIEQKDFFQAKQKNDRNFNFNIYYLDSGGKSLIQLVDQITKDNSNNKSYKLFEKESFEIKNLETVRLLQKLDISEAPIHFEQYLIYVDSETSFLISFFSKLDMHVKLYHQLFTEIAFSFRYNSKKPNRTIDKQ